jgi:hypothetical protein
MVRMLGKAIMSHFKALSWKHQGKPKGKSKCKYLVMITDLAQIKMRATPYTNAA